MVSKTNNITINADLLLTRKDVSLILHIGLSTLDSSETYKLLKRVHIGRHTFFLRDDVMQFILDHREGGAE